MKVDIYYRVCNDLANEFVNFENRKRNYVNIYSFFCMWVFDRCKSIYMCCHIKSW